MSLDKLINDLIDRAISEDIGDGDHSSLACVPENTVGKAKLLVKENGIIAGVEIAKKVFGKIDNSLNLDITIIDGSEVKIGDLVFTVEGKSHSILQAERIVLNIMQRMSGIATRTNEYVKKLDGLKAKVLDTRKTTPGMRVLEKMAVKIGGGENHRFGLYDMILVKDNHIDFAGGIESAIKKTHNYLERNGKKIPVEIEVRNWNELEQVMKTGWVDRIMLDNFTPSETKKAVEYINGKYEVESSGGINLKTVRAYAECGVNYISVGDLTHHIKSIDLSLKAF
ncbi:MAG: carboxylating nicotinate-nucleotide diphosphorylase [Bacteroidales bacterium]|nr:carboxylating nicotinate-nucleotide diphosphorylase [Bacteroidales bacterium]MBN2757350.1 carboxylating nicotinate-nucleotide diphosphorylase [Bacteroidales bacterium]